MAGDDGKEAVDSGRPSSPTPQAAQAKREEEKLTKIEAIMKKEQLVSCLVYTHCTYSNTVYFGDFKLPYCWRT